MVGSSSSATSLAVPAERRDAATAVEAQHAKGKLTARERLEVLLDEGSFEDLGGLAENPVADVGAASVVAGSGTISGRPVCVFAQDATAGGGAVSQADKIMQVQDLALRTGAPIIGLFDGGGVRIREGVAALDGYAGIFQRTVLASGVVPQISLIMGPCAGGDVLAPALSDFIFMVRGTSTLFVTGPDVVKAVINETVTAQALGGAEVHAVTSAVADGAYDTDVDALLQMRRLVDFLPTSNRAPLPQWLAPAAVADDGSLDTLVPDDPAAPYDIKELVAKVADDGDVFEIQAAHAKNIVTAFGRVEGRTVGFVANQPAVLAGVLDADAARKAARFVRFCDGFDIPLVTFVDVPGFLPGVEAEHGGLAKHAAKLVYAYGEATVPKITLVTRKAFGAAYAAMGSKPLGGDLNLAWPTARIAAMGGEGVAAENGHVDAVIRPRETRREVARGLAMLRGKALQTPWKKHGTVPL